MPYVPGFDNDLFLSYASGDNREGAVAEFTAVVEKTISDNLVNCVSPQEKIRIYFDRNRLTNQAGVNWEEHLKAAATSSALLVPLLSSNYLSSEYCTREREWFGMQSHVSQGYPYAVVRWLPPTPGDPVPKEFEKAQGHGGHSSAATWLALMSPDERKKSAQDFALRLRDRLVEMRASISAVFLGPATGRGKSTRSRLRDELEKSGHRVVPKADFEYQDTSAVSGALKTALVAIHFPGDGLDLEGLSAIEESFRSRARTLLVQPFGSTPSDEEAALLEEIAAEAGSGGKYAGVTYTSLEGKTDDQVWDIVKRDVRAARFRREKSEFAVGVACEARDLTGAKAVADLIAQLGLRAQYPSFDAAAGITEKLQALRATITQSQALLCYWAQAEGRGLEKRVEQDARRGYKAKAWYLAPPLNVPAKDRLAQSKEMVLRQQAAEADIDTLEPFLRELGWEPPAP